MTPEALRARMALALDVPSKAEAMALAASLEEHFAVVKVGLELFGAEGPGCVEELADAGFEVFLDLKFHDIPNTVRRAAAAVARSGASWLTVHASGGRAMIEAAVEGFGSSTGETRTQPPARGVLGVTVLTSSQAPSSDAVARLAREAVTAGCAGVVCGGGEVGMLRREIEGVACVVPGIRLEGDRLGDQARVSTPRGALAAGAAMLVVGRAVTAAASPLEAAARIRQDALGAAGA